MITKVTVTREDDLVGGPASESVRFGLDGVHYEIDLNAENAQAFRQQLTPFIDHARKPAAGQPYRAARTAAHRQRSRAIRAWAKGQGVPVGDRGRFPARVIEQYEAATPSARKAGPHSAPPGRRP